MKILEDRYKRIFSTGYVALLLGAVAVGFAVAPQNTHAASSPLGVMIPLYTYPTDASWAAVIQAKQAYPNVPFIAVINPNSGQGGSQDSNYVQGIKNLQGAGIRVLGYVDTAYAGDSLSSVEANVNLYKSWYAVDGIFFDDMTNVAGYESYYSTLSAYVHSLIPGSTTIGNPGTSVPTSYIGTLDVLDIYESSPYPSLSFITYSGYSPNYFSNIVYGVPLSTAYLTSIVGINSWVYVTDANLPNPYDVLPSYFISEVATLSSIDGTVAITSSSTSSGGAASLSVNSADLSGNAITGMWTTWNQNGAVLASGYTPTTFTGTSGGTYTVTVADYGSTVFCHWQDGSTNPDRTLTLSGNSAVTAYYSTSGSCPATTTTTTSSSTTTSSTTSATQSVVSITVQSATSSGTLSGMWTVVSQNGVTLLTGYTPLTFMATAGGSYTISVANYGNYVFSHWSTGSTSPTITISPSQTMTLTAYYSVTCSSHHKHC